MKTLLILLAFVTLVSCKHQQQSYYCRQNIKVGYPNIRIGWPDSVVYYYWDTTIYSPFANSTEQAEVIIMDFPCGNGVLIKNLEETKFNFRQLTVLPEAVNCQ